LFSEVLLGVNYPLCDVIRKRLDCTILWSPCRSRTVDGYPRYGLRANASPQITTSQQGEWNPFCFEFQLNELWGAKAIEQTVTLAGASASTGRKSTSASCRGSKHQHQQVSDRSWLVTFMDYDFGYFDDETCRLEPVENPFGPKVLPMCPE
jgi:hypothetical protein